MDEDRIPEIIQTIRLKNNWSQGVLAEILKVTPATISAWERGVRVPKRIHQLDIKHKFPWVEEYENDNH